MAVDFNLSNSTDSYRRGVILGLSMAEILMIFLFVFLTSSSVVLVQAEAKMKEAAQKAEEAERKSRQAEEKAALADELVKRLGQPKEENVDKIFPILPELGRALASGYSIPDIVLIFKNLPPNSSPARRLDGTEFAWARATRLALETAGVHVPELIANADLTVAIQRLVKAGYAPAQLKNLLENLPDSWKPADLPDDWKEVAWNNAELARMIRAGVDTKKAVEHANVSVEVQGLIDRGYAVNQIQELLAAIPRFWTPENLPRDWSRLVQVADALRVLDSVGVRIETLIAGSRAIVAIQKLVDQGFSFPQLTNMLTAISNAWKPATLPQDWNRVAEAFTWVTALEAAEVDVARLAANPATAATIQQLMEKGFTPTKPEAKPEAPAKQEPSSGNWPPMIPLTEAGGYYFPTNLAVLSEEFKWKLRTDIFEKIIAAMTEYDVDVIEVTGNTDERAVNRQTSNLDSQLLPVIHGGIAIETIRPADNAGLGLARAVAVVKELMTIERFKGVTMIPLSAAQLVDSSGRLTNGTEIGDIPERRRIEIRLRRSDRVGR
jgi:hypothetical protein